MTWAFIFLYILGINIHQATGEGKNISVQMYYVKLTVDKSAFGNITQLLASFAGNSTPQVEDLQMTTVCERVSAQAECSCKPGFRWSDDVCASKGCCGNNKCTFDHMSSPHRCVSNNTVTIKGSVTIKGTRYQDCLAHTQESQDCKSNLLAQMKKVYSTLRGFEDLKIIDYRVGSIIVDFEMTLVTTVDPQVLVERSEVLVKSLSARFDLETTGLVRLVMPENPVKYNDAHTLVCMLNEGLDVIPEWQWQLIGPDDQVSKITNGTESQIQITRGHSTLHLNKITEVWAGEFRCTFTVYTNSGKVTHSARADLDVALLPNIDKTTDPQFPRCQNTDDLLTVTGTCDIGSINESYTVTWSNGDKRSTIISETQPQFSGGTFASTVRAVVGCNATTQPPQLTCTFVNRRNQSKSATVDIIVIHVGEQFCEAVDDWVEAKAGHTAVLKCQNAHGQRRRKCSAIPVEWEEEESECINQEVNKIQQKASMVDIGIGDIDENAGEVFSILNDVTNNTGTINTYANMNASVGILLTLSVKLNKISNESAVNDFLHSSSNLMDKSLQGAWSEREDDDDDDNLTMAETYLNSVERLVEASNITGLTKKTNIEVALCSKAQGSNCTNKAFNVTVNFYSSDTDRVKTTGFKQLENYLPNKDDKYTPNSIIVSTTAGKHSGSVKVEISFPLHRPRPKNVEIKCVWWDNTTRQWSANGCEWKSSTTEAEGHCVCSHLSSFAILMARDPIEIPCMTEITYVGLSVSIVSLFISLVIELIIWSIVVKTNTLYLRHTAHMNISLCLLVAHCCFLASSKPREISETWCKTFAVLSHFFYLATFFWTLCLSSTLLHQAVFLFNEVSKKTYLRFSLTLGYICPFLIVTITFLSNSGGAKGMYFSTDTCWLVYTRGFNGSILTFLIPVGTIIIVNLFSMLVVIMKLLNHPMTTGTSHHSAAAKTVMRTVVLLTPIFGVTWLFGFGVTVLDLTYGDLALVVNYVFVLMNSFQGLFILLTTCLGDKQVRDALLTRLRLRTSATTTDSTAGFDKPVKK